IAPKKPAVGPNEEVEVEVTTRDQLGRPVAAEVAVALVDRALLRLYQDRLPPIGGFFYNQSRVGAFATQATNTFQYQPPTIPVARAVVEDREQDQARKMDQLQHGIVMEQAQRQLAMTPPALAMPAPMGRPSGGGGAMGGRGGMPGGADPQANFFHA